MISLTDTWKAAVRGDWSPVVNIRIDTGGTNFNALSAAVNYATTRQVGLHRVDFSESKINPMTRKASVASITAQVADEWIRPIYVNNRLRAQLVTISVGAAELSLSDFQTVFVGIISNVRPVAGQYVELEADDVRGALLYNKITGAFAGDHPLNHAYSILLDKLGTNYINGASFNFNTQVPDRSHFVVNRVGVSIGGSGSNEWFDPIDEPTPGNEVLDDLAFLLDGSIVCRESGVIEFIAYDPDASAVAVWDDDILIGPIESVDQSDELMANQIAVSFAGTKDKDSTAIYTANDLDSQAAHASVALSGIITQNFTTHWCTSYANIEPADGLESSGGYVMSPTTPAQFLLIGNVHLFCGSLYAYSSTGQPSAQKISAGHPLYIRVDDEIIRITRLEAKPGAFGAYQNVQPSGSSSTVSNIAIHATCSGITRGMFGTTPASHKTGAWAEDWTIPIMIAQEKLRRFKNGCDVIQVTTGFDQFAVQQGDFVAIDEPRYLGYGMNGLTTSTRWEVIAKSPQLFDGGTIKWTLAKVVDEFPNMTHIIGNQGGRAPKGDLISSVVNNDIIANSHSPTNPTTVGNISGRTATLSAGDMVSSAGTRRFSSEYNHTFTANRDTYVAKDTLTGVLSFQEVGVGATMPRKGSSEVWVAKVRTNATAIVLNDHTIGQRQPTAARQSNVKSSYVANKSFSQMSRR